MAGGRAGNGYLSTRDEFGGRAGVPSGGPLVCSRRLVAEDAQGRCDQVADLGFTERVAAGDRMPPTGGDLPVIT
ncbi:MULTISPECIES: hypothetical protein [Pseudofrankia]|uniref:hypothetical protein n=1 Tax=Pseudofrankia TaxID=2994363 RepID=UPI0004811A67|nr:MULTISPECIES: hypothetical protein [Pseudofrankia]OHV37012.1 hypothetical protein BCD49_17370 [Pseudofrankia sp. EUN1h]